MNLDIERIRHVAELAELSLDSEEESRFAGEIGRIVVLFAELDAIDTTGVPATAHIAATDGANPGWRPDEAKPGLVREEILAAAPAVERDGFAVPTFVG